MGETNHEQLKQKKRKRNNQMILFVGGGGCRDAARVAAVDGCEAK
jgi:glycerol dehydrogenase-like iron-containing ADH family enzyme